MRDICPASGGRLLQYKHTGFYNEMLICIYCAVVLMIYSFTPSVIFSFLIQLLFLWSFSLYLKKWKPAVLLYYLSSRLYQILSNDNVPIAISLPRNLTKLVYLFEQLFNLIHVYKTVIWCSFCITTFVLSVFYLTGEICNFKE